MQNLIRFHAWSRNLRRRRSLHLRLNIIYSAFCYCLTVHKKLFQKPLANHPTYAILSALLTFELSETIHVLDSPRAPRLSMFNVSFPILSLLASDISYCFYLRRWPIFIQQSASVSPSYRSRGFPNKSRFLRPQNPLPTGLWVIVLEHFALSPVAGNDQKKTHKRAGQWKIN